MEEPKIRKQIKLSKAGYKNFVGKDIDEDFGFLPLHQFDRVYKHFQDEKLHMGMIENAVGSVRRFSKKEIELFIEILKEEGICLVLESWTSYRSTDRT